MAKYNYLPTYLPTYNCHCFYPVLFALPVSGDKKGEEGWPVKGFIFKVPVANNASTI